MDDIVVLWVEDSDDDFGQLSPAVVSDKALKVHRTRRKDETEAWLLEHRCHAIVLDLRLDNGEGVDLFLAIKTQARGAAILVLTGFDNSRLFKRLAECGAADVMVKRGYPEESRDVWRRLKEMLERHRKHGGVPALHAMRDEVRAARRDLERFREYEETTAQTGRRVLEKLEQLERQLDEAAAEFGSGGGGDGAEC